MSKALIVVDVQNDFCEGGSLAVEGGNAVAERIRDYIYSYDAEYDTIVFTKDWHEAPPSDNGGHFALDAEPDFVDTWPVHCVIGTTGADYHPAVAQAFKAYSEEREFRKGTGRPDYSGFQGINAGHRYLDEFLTNADITHVDVAGLAGDYCVRETALSAVERGYKVTLLDNLIASVRGDEATEAVMAEVAAAQK